MFREAEYGQEIERLFGKETAAEWRLVLRRFEFGTDFAFIVVLVPDESASRLCADDLEKFLADGNQAMMRLTPTTPDELRELPARLVLFDRTDDIRAVWISAVAPTSSLDFEAWRLGWLELAARLNERRDMMRFWSMTKTALIFAGAPWLKVSLRNVAPDLWSVLSTVVEIKPSVIEFEIDAEEPEPEKPAWVRDLAPDPEFALQTAEKVRGPGHELQLADILFRAGVGFAERDEWNKAEDIFRQVSGLRERYGGSMSSRGQAVHELARILRKQKRLGEAETGFRQALALREQVGDLLGQAITLDELGRTLRALGRLEEAEAVFRKALELGEQGGAPPLSRNFTINNLGRLLRGQKRLNEAERLFRQALSLTEQIDGVKIERALTLDYLGRTLRDQNCLEDAEQAFREAWLLARQGEASPISQGTILSELARTLKKQGRFEEADELFQQAKELLKHSSNQHSSFPARQSGSAIGQLRILAEDDEHLADFKDYIS